MEKGPKIFFQGGLFFFFFSIFFAVRKCGWVPKKNNFKGGNIFFAVNKVFIWADAFLELRCVSVCLFVCLSDVPFSCIFFLLKSSFVAAAAMAAGRDKKKSLKASWRR